MVQVQEAQSTLCAREPGGGSAVLERWGIDSEYGVLRTSERFWEQSDRLQEDHRLRNPVEFGLLDYNRLEGF